MLSRVLPCPLPAGPRNSDSHAFGQHFYLFDRLHKTGSRRDRRLRLKYDISPTAKSLSGKLFSIRFREKSGNNGPNFRRLCQARMIYQLGISKKAACRTSPLLRHITKRAANDRTNGVNFLSATVFAETDE